MMYHGYQVESGSHKRSGNEWQVAVVITKHDDLQGKSFEQTFTVERYCPTKEEADREALELGRRIIDGDVAGMSVEDL